MIIMVSAEELLSGISGMLRNILSVLSKPRRVITGYKDNISTAGVRLVEKPTPIHRVVTVKVRDLGTGNYIAFGDEIEQPFRLNATGESLDIDWIDDLHKVVVVTDIGTTGVVEFIGG